MSAYEEQIATPVRTAAADCGGMALVKTIAIEAAQTLSGTARDALLAHAMTGSAVASILIVAEPHFEVLLRCIFHGRG